MNYFTFTTGSVESGALAAQATQAAQKNTILSNMDDVVEDNAVSKIRPPLIVDR